MCSILDDLTDLIIRPPRRDYTKRDLGPREGSLNGRPYRRTDFTIQNNEGQRLECSLFERADTYQNQHYNPCVIYCHGNAGCRTESHNLIPVLIPRGIALVVFDFTGCGRSEGDYITLGWREQSDLE
ncbi:MAG: hypothetical protein EZS28_048966, partial [Streblomastix strix]